MKVTAAPVLAVEESSCTTACRIEQPTRVELVINLRTDKAIAIRVPQTVLLRYVARGGRDLKLLTSYRHESRLTP